MLKKQQSFVRMAIASSRVQIIEGEDHVVAVKTERIIDPESGVAIEVEKAIIAVDLGDGRIAVQERERVVGAMIQVKVNQDLQL